MDRPEQGGLPCAGRTSCVTEGRMRYSQERRLATRGAVKCVPVS